MPRHDRAGRPRRRGVEIMRSMIDRLDALTNAERRVWQALEENCDQHNGEANDEGRHLLRRLRTLEDEWARLSLRIVFEYAGMSPAQRARVNTLRRNQIVSLRLLWLFIGVSRLA